MAKLIGILQSVLFLSFLSTVWAHGRLIDPPNRGTMWRYGFNNPDNYQDHELNCGGQKRQWEVNDGRCGHCGDPYDMSPRAHEAGGKYANGIIVDTYQEGAMVKFTLDITAPHKGWFEFRLCPVNNPKVRVSQSCLDRFLLKFTNGQTKYYMPNKAMADNLTVEVRLPRGLTCSQCVLQWKYHTGKDWGCDKPGNSASCCVGCGAQEEFYGCADVTIVKRGGVITRAPTSRPRTTPPIKTTKPRTTQRTTTNRRTTRRTTPTNRRTTRRTTTTRPTTLRRTFIWQRTTTTKKPVTTTTARSATTKRPIYVRTTTTSWWKKPVTHKHIFTKRPYYTKKPTTRKSYYTNRPIYTRRPTTRGPQEGKIPTWTWKAATTTSSSRYRWLNNRLRK